MCDGMEMVELLLYLPIRTCYPQTHKLCNILGVVDLRRVFNFGLMVRGLSQRPNLTDGPAATWYFRRPTKEEEGVVD
jgi:hypothetical protein